MKLGFLTTYDKDRIAFARRSGFGSIQLLISPGDPLDPTRTGSDALLEAKDYLASAGVEVSAIGTYYVNCLHPDPTQRDDAVRFFEAVMGLCATLGVTTLGTVPGRDPDQSIEANIPAFREVFSRLSQIAEQRGLRVAFENCPRFHYFPFRGVNIAYCSRAWDLMFDAVPSAVLGLEYDPSHPVSMLMDPIEPIYQYGDKIWHVHAKDTEIMRENLATDGIFQPGMFRYRLPGYGDVNWKRFLSALLDMGYQGNLDIEGCKDCMVPDDDAEAGLLLGKQFLEQLLPGAPAPRPAPR